ncbi:TlpA family protein disulfide reductase [Zhouia spongiae]|uniref:TlpA family protein disulfide reductase n=1 Tax=Zhouia spongiae TaxID=2202721 RepID=A0ABY3YLI6_9FLAO|nr:TlpA disulfide reductase family protein [Zhouia spongiae]UNY98558.1 TlpA family protein disulfide reductase [Zhouia spongiae]
MKKIIIILTFLVFTACHKEPKVTYTVINGKIASKGEVNKLILTNNDRDFKYEIALLEDGSFQDSLTIEPGLYTLSAGHRKSIDIVFFRGDDLFITFDADNLDTSLRFEGKGSDENNLLQAINKKIKEWNQQKPETCLFGEKDFKSTLIEKKEELLTLLNDSMQLNPAFKNFRERHINYWYIYSLSRYQGEHRYYAKTPEFTVSDDFLSETKHIDYGIDNDYRASVYYYRLVNDKHWEKTDSLVKAGASSSSVARLESANGFKSEYIRNALLYRSILGILALDNIFKPSYDTYIKLSTNQEHKNMVTEKYQEVKVLEKGNPSPGFIDYENYSGGFTSLDQLKGKYVYIDVWATWCGPCKAEMPFLKEVEKKYHENDNIEFVSISVDSKKEYDKWKTMIKEKELIGIQLIADNAFKSDFIRLYQIIGIPQFILIDPDGNIVNRSAPRPSSPRLIELFNELGI